MCSLLNDRAERRNAGHQFCRVCLLREIYIGAAHVCDRPRHLVPCGCTVHMNSTKCPVKPCKPAEQPPLKFLRPKDRIRVPTVLSVGEEARLFAALEWPMALLAREIDPRTEQHQTSVRQQPRRF